MLKRDKTNNGSISAAEKKIYIHTKPANVPNEIELFFCQEYLIEMNPGARTYGQTSMAALSELTRPSISSRKPSGTLANGEAAKTPVPSLVAVENIRSIAIRVRDTIGCL